MEPFSQQENQQRKRQLSPEEAELEMILESHPDARLSTDADGEPRYNNSVIFAVAIIFLGFILMLEFFCTDMQNTEKTYAQSVRVEIAKISVFKPIRAEQKTVKRYMVSYYYTDDGQPASGCCFLDDHSAEEQNIRGTDTKPSAISVTVPRKRTAVFDLDVIRVVVVIAMGVFVIMGIMVVQLAKRTRAEYAAGKYVLYESNGRIVSKRLGH